MKKAICTFLLFAAVCTGGGAFATETEHLGMQFLPAPGKMVIDGRFDDWDLTGGILACSDVENLRDQYGVWFHTMYDGENRAACSDGTGEPEHRNDAVGEFSGQPTRESYYAATRTTAWGDIECHGTILE